MNFRCLSVSDIDYGGLGVFPKNFVRFEVYLPLQKTKAIFSLLTISQSCSSFNLADVFFYSKRCGLRLKQEKELLGKCTFFLVEIFK
jgi:hypothetical protein